MIPLTLKLTGFLSYREPQELDFTRFELACISGHNGAGKSSLLDAITWALFGQARKRDESLINAAASAAEIVFTFAYENTTYRIQRTIARGKTGILEFQILDENQQSEIDNPKSVWRPLTEKSNRETQNRIEHILRLDYETFVNASFFLQGKADQFTQQKAGDRKRILSSILGLEVWETYKERTAERRKAIERELGEVDGRIGEVNDELGQETERKAHLAALEIDLNRLVETRKAQESVLENMKLVAASLVERKKLADALRGQITRNQSTFNLLQRQLDDRTSERDDYAHLLARASEVESAFAAWQAARETLAKWDQTAQTFREQEKKRQPFLDEINSAKLKLEHEKSALTEQLAKLDENKSVIVHLKTEIEVVRKQLEETEEKIKQRDENKKVLGEQKEKFAALQAENSALKTRMVELDERIKRLEVVEGAECPLCGQSLTEAHRAETLAQMQADGKTMGDTWRANKASLDSLRHEITTLDSLLSNLSSLENERLARSGLLSTLTERLETLHTVAETWKKEGGPRLKEVSETLDKGKYAPTAQKSLAALDKELKSLGYDASAHDAAKQAEVAGRSAETDFRALEKARAALSPVEREITSLSSQISNLKSEIENLQSQLKDSADDTPIPDADGAERALYATQEQENRLRQEVGAARQKVNVLADLRTRKKRLEAEREALALQISRHKALERAFGKDGVPALLIEQALPEIETEANELLDRLSNGAMSVRFVTQREYKDAKRDDLKETLDIQISDGAGLRDYEMFSGGEAFRVNFAIRLALSKVLAQRTGARLQTLVIDEGFGSQDAEGRQRLIEAINTVRGDFAKILIITHLDELKDAFPNRIEVEKTPNGSVVSVI